MTNFQFLFLISFLAYIQANLSESSSSSESGDEIEKLDFSMKPDESHQSNSGSFINGFQKNTPTTVERDIKSIEPSKAVNLHANICSMDPVKINSIAAAGVEFVDDSQLNDTYDDEPFGREKNSNEINLSDVFADVLEGKPFLIYVLME